MQTNTFSSRPFVSSVHPTLFPLYAISYMNEYKVISASNRGVYYYIELANLTVDGIANTTSYDIQTSSDSINIII
jgi:hypothetical protein